MKIGTEYELYRSEEWGSIGGVLSPNCWIWTFTPTGYNGRGCFAGIEKTKWRNSGEVCRDQPRSLQYGEQVQMENRLFARTLMEEPR